jgi:hypothetical protein
MSKIPLSEQIDTLTVLLFSSEHMVDEARAAIAAALSTLKWVERHQAELRVLGEFPIEKIEVLTPQATCLSAIAQERDEGEK